jgi:hypothetical protein
MRIRILFLLGLLTTCVACQPATSNQVAETPPGSLSQEPGKICGTAALYELRNEQGTIVGSLEVFNDSSQLWLRFELAKGLAYRSSSIRYLPPATEQWNDFPVLGPRETGYAAGIPLSERQQGDCLSFEGEFLVQSTKDSTVLKGRISAPDRPNRISYCIQSCIRFSAICQPTKLAQDFRTFPAGAWLGEGPQMGRPLDAARFERAFPEGLPVGCTSAKTLKEFTAVRGWIASASPEKKALAREYVALSLNLAFDVAESDFAPGPEGLGQLVLADGDFKGWTTQALWEEIQAALGDCPSSYAFLQLSEAAQGINGNFYPPTNQHGFLICPTE